MNSVIISIDNLRTYKYDPSIKTAVYVDGDFDEWYLLVKKKFPNVKKIICRDSRLTNLCCMGIKFLDCSNNKLTFLKTDAKHVKCDNNLLKRLNLPNTSTVKCNNNKLKHLRCNKALYVECKNNSLSNLWLPNTLCVICDEDVVVYSPNAILFMNK